MKVALCLFGQPRNIENLKVIESHKKWIMSKYDTDVFCHTWYSRDYDFKRSEWTEKTLSSIKCPENAIELISSNYNPKLLKHDAPMTFELDSSITNCEKFSKHEWFIKNMPNNYSSQSFSIEEVTKLVETHIRNTATRYDFIISARYDIIIDEFPDLNTLDKKYFYIMNHHPRFPDIFAIFPPRFLNSQHYFEARIGVLKKMRDNDLPLDIYWEPSCECIKYNSFLLFHDKSDIRGVYIREHRNE
jgi:hypothetical protein